MDQPTLNSFRARIHDWVQQRLETGRYPFRRIEACPELFCDQGVEIPDLVLWINRSSCLAGAVLLIPTKTDEESRRRGKRAAQALGLANFVLWSARNISIWSVDQQNDTPIETLELSSLSAVTAQDFETILDQLLSRLKVFAVSGLMARETLPPGYFANLCRLALDDLLPAQLEVSRISVDGTCSDNWAERVAREKAWLTLWRLLLLVSEERLPPRFQPHRLEQVMTYTLADFDLPQETGLAIDSEEPELSEEASICFHHLGNRLKQLGWEDDRERAAASVAILLHRAAIFFGVAVPPLAESPAETSLTVNLADPRMFATPALVAAAPFRAGMDLLAALRRTQPQTIQASSVTELHEISVPTETTAYLSDRSIPDVEDRSKRLLKLRKVWPNHRFSLPADSPTWVWEGLHLTGILSDSASLQLMLAPQWAFDSGVKIFWRYLLKRHQLASCRVTDGGLTFLNFAPPGEEGGPELMRREGPVRLERDIAVTQSPALLNFCLLCHREILELVQSGQLRPWHGLLEGDLFRQRTKEIFLFLHTSVGLHILQHLLNKTEPPSLGKMPEALVEASLLLPGEDILAAFAALDWMPGQKQPERSRLDRILRSCWGKLPAVSMATPDQSKHKIRNKDRHKLRLQIAESVFIDGIPRFPEDYLRQYYRPALQNFLIPGPLQPFDRFFGKFFLRTEDGAEIQADDEATARALLVTSRLGRETVQLPRDATIGEQILSKYLDDMEALWRTLVRECRRQVPVRAQALSMARSVWKEQRLPRIDSLTSALRR